MKWSMLPHVSKLIALSLGSLLVACSSPPAAFPAHTEFGSRLTHKLFVSGGGSGVLEMTVEYPEGFRGAEIRGEALADDQGGVLTLVLHSLHSEKAQICVSGEIAAVVNSKGIRGRDDNETSLSVENFVPMTTTMIPQQLCSGEQDQQTCVPVTFPMSIPGDLAMLVHAEPAHRIRLRPNSFLVLRLSDQQCGSNIQTQ